MTQITTYKKGKLKNAIEKTQVQARWIALYQAVNLIADKSEEMGKDFETLDLSPLKIKSYIDSTADIIHRNLLKTDHNIDIVYSEEEK